MAKPKVRYIIRDREQSPAAEAYRAIVASLQATNTGGVSQVLLFTGASPGEGTALTVLNVAAVLAYAGKKVVLLDGDLRSPLLHDIIGVPNRGFAEVVAKGDNWREVIQDTGINGLKLLAAGSPAQHPIEMLSNPAVRELLAELKAAADYVLINGSPILFQEDEIWSDACVWAAKSDGVVLVLERQAVRVTDAQKALELLNGAKANIIGSVLNEVRTKDLVYHTSAV